MSDRYRLKDGRVFNRTCELNIVEHCNLRCRSCAHLSPILPSHFVTPEALQRDLSALAKSYRVRIVRLLGGEPLMHPNLFDIVTAVRESGITESIEITTNGLLLPRMEPRVWDAVDAVRISLYPGRSLKPDKLRACVERAEQHHVTIRYKRYESFQEAYSEQGTDDGALVGKIFATCNSVHRWRCHTIADGWFFKCAQSYMIPKGMQQSVEAIRANGIRIDDTPDFRDRLLSYLTSAEPLPACQNCLGSAGRYIKHEQVRRDEFRAVQTLPTEHLIHPRLVGPGRLALARAESMLPRAVVEPAEQAMKSSDAVVGVIRKVQRFNSNLFRSDTRSRTP